LQLANCSFAAGYDVIRPSVGKAFGPTKLAFYEYFISFLHFEIQQQDDEADHKRYKGINTAQLVTGVEREAQDST
jgi:hypothetical protein